MLIFSLIISFVVGSQFQPNPAAFIIAFFGSRAVFYQLWFQEIQKSPTPWMRVLTHTIILIIILPIVIAVSGFLLPSISNNLFWFVVIPFVGILTSLALHNIYKLS
ncbi:MAG: hypothetical protein A2Z11_01770 [Candidatus Woykebacteria bacterium RBG_16_43_9]|uniref:Uncharacterized protein n=1 Tax=Candidatus Woykebacteria bacterium RBG_16_43_9 TaxID=1802596 RepID=A0A1G1WC33_9BACT|nr:MAG: hypothetical protein A2Z11_01770 [Candidatus Woykebacteria bacterium RBG_16_43_9]